MMMMMKMMMLLLPLSSSYAMAFYYPKATDSSEIRDVSDLTSTTRDGRVYWYSNGTAVVNSTTVLLATGFATIIGLGVASVLHEAATGDFPTAPPNRTREDDNNNNKRLAVVLSSSGREEVERYHREMVEYEARYEQYLRDYAAWAEVFGQDPRPPTPPPDATARKRRYFTHTSHIPFSLLVLGTVLLHH